MPAAVPVRPFKKLLVANRSEIAIRVFRSAHELGIRTVAIYSHEDRFALHRFKADEAYPRRQARRADPGLPRHPRHRRPRQGASASMRSIPATASCRRTPRSPAPAGEAGITFVGPRPEVLEQLGDKVAARRIAQQANVPVLSGSDDAGRRPTRKRRSSPRSSATR